MKRRKLLFESLERRDLLAVGLPYSQSFYILPIENWTYESSNDGRIEVVGGRLRMDDSVNGGSYSRNKAILHANLVGQQGVRLEFDHWDLNDEDTFSDGIHLSVDGTNWEKVWDAKQGTFDLDLDKLAAGVGLSYTEDFLIGFWQYDNYGAPSDGREWDNIKLHAPPPPPPPTAQIVTLGQPYIQSFDLKPGPTEGWEYTSTNDGRIEVVDGRLRMDDSVNGGSYSLNEAILHVDLQGSFDAYLYGFHRDISDEEHDQDGIFISADGMTWEALTKVSGNFTLLIPDGTTMIKFSQYDNYGADSDGREWDNLRLELYDHTQQIDWPEELGFYKDLFIDGGAHVSDKGTYAADFLGLTYQTLFTESTSYQNSIMVSSATDSNGALLYPDGQPRFRMYYMNGGSSGDHVASLKTSTTPDGLNGKDLVQQFFAMGGSYAGSCAGAFAAGSGISRYFELIPNTRFKSSMPWGINVDATFDAPADKPFSDVMKGLGFGTKVTNIPTYGGPVYKPGIDTYYGPVPDGLQYFGKNVRNGYGAPQVAAYKGPGTGQMAILSGHPEYRSSGSNLGLMATVYKYAIDGARKIPDLKDSLVVGDVVQMMGPKQRVGDKQYHRFTVDVTPGTSTLDVSLTGLSANADLYVQCNSPANEKSYLAKGTQTGIANENVQVDVSQACSVLHVSVYGAHDIKNGAAYSLMVS